MFDQVTAVHEVMHTMKTNLANIKNVLAVWDRPLMERKPKPVDRDEFERAHKGIKTSRYAEIKEGGKVSSLALCSPLFRCFFTCALMLQFSSCPDPSAESMLPSTKELHTVNRCHMCFVHSCISARDPFFQGLGVWLASRLSPLVTYKLGCDLPLKTRNESYCNQVLALISLAQRAGRLASSVYSINLELQLTKLLVRYSGCVPCDILSLRRRFTTCSRKTTKSSSAPMRRPTGVGMWTLSTMWSWTACRV